jgi:ribosome-associated translation inhibitor RaiA
MAATHLDKIENDLRRLKHKSKVLEQELSNRFTHLGSNYKSMAMNSVMPGIANSSMLGMIGTFAKSALKNRGKGSIWNTLLFTALEIVGVKLGVQLVDKFKNRRRKKPSQAPPADMESEYDYQYQKG